MATAEEETRCVKLQTSEAVNKRWRRKTRSWLVVRGPLCHLLFFFSIFLTVVCLFPSGFSFLPFFIYLFYRFLFFFIAFQILASVALPLPSSDLHRPSLKNEKKMESQRATKGQRVPCRSRSPLQPQLSWSMLHAYWKKRCLLGPRVAFPSIFSAPFVAICTRSRLSGFSVTFLPSPPAGPPWISANLFVRL